MYVAASFERNCPGRPLCHIFSPNREQVWLSTSRSIHFLIPKSIWSHVGCLYLGDFFCFWLWTICRSSSKRKVKYLRKASGPWNIAILHTLVLLSSCSEEWARQSLLFQVCFSLSERLDRELLMWALNEYPTSLWQALKGNLQTSIATSVQKVPYWIQRQNADLRLNQVAWRLIQLRNLAMRQVDTKKRELTVFVAALQVFCQKMCHLVFCMPCEYHFIRAVQMPWCSAATRATISRSKAYIFLETHQSDLECA